MNGCNYLLLLGLFNSGGDDVLAAAESDQAVGMGCQAVQIRMVLMCEHHPDFLGQPLQEQRRKEDAVVLVVGAELPHVGEQLRRFSAAEGLHHQKQFHPLEVGELMTS